MRVCEVVKELKFQLALFYYFSVMVCFNKFIFSFRFDFVKPISTINNQNTITVKRKSISGGKQFTDYLFIKNI